MALFVSKTAAQIIPKSSTYLKSTIKPIVISRNGLLVTSNQSIFYPHSISSKSHFNGCELNGSKHNFSTSAAKLGDSSTYFTKKHEWVSVVGNLGTVGITDYAQQALGNNFDNFLTKKASNLIQVLLVKNVYTVIIKMCAHRRCCVRSIAGC